MQKAAPKKNSAPERRSDPNEPESKQTYTKKEFIEEYGKKKGLAAWKAAAPNNDPKTDGAPKKRPAGGAVPTERRRDPNEPESKKTYTRAEFIREYGENRGAALWRQAGDAAPRNESGPERRCDPNEPESKKMYTKYDEAHFLLGTHSTRTSLSPSNDKNDATRYGQDQYKAGLRYLGDKDTQKAAEKFASALRLYDLAAEAGLCERDSAVIGKNVMTVHWRAAQCCESGRDAMDHVRKAVLRSLTATEDAKVSDDEVLALNIEKRRTEIIADTARTYLDDYGFYDVLALIPAGVQRAEAYLEVADALYKEAVRTDVNAVGYPIFSILAKCYRPLVDARQHAHTHADIVKLVDTMEEGISGLQGIAESERARNNGKALLDAAVHGFEELQTDGVFAALDCFKQAGLYARRTGSVLVQEVLASREAGHLYAEVLGMRERAKAELSHCFSLALSLQGNHEAKPWYIISKRLLETGRKKIPRQS